MGYLIGIGITERKEERESTSLIRYSWSIFISYTSSVIYTFDTRNYICHLYTAGKRQIAHHIYQDVIHMTYSFVLSKTIPSVFCSKFQVHYEVNVHASPAAPSRFSRGR